MELLGSDALQARSAYQPTIARQGDRWILYVGHHGGKSVNPLTGNAEDNGTSILDVTDPRRPKPLFHIPGEPGSGESGGAQMVRVCAARTLPNADKSKFYMLRTFGNLGHEVWDVTDPSKPSLLSTLVQGPQGHAQELLGVRHRHRVPRFGRGRVAHAAHDAGLRPLGSREAEAHPRFRPRGTAAWSDRAHAHRTARHDLHRPAGQPHLLRLRHQQVGSACRSSIATSSSMAPRSRRTRTCAQPASRAPRAAALDRRAHDVPDARHGSAGVREGPMGRQARLRR